MGKLQDYNLDRAEVLARIGCGWTMLPNFWVDELVRVDEKKYPHVPTSFWKFLIVLWRELFRYRYGKDNWTATLTMRDFGIDANYASLWASALGASGLFTLEKGEFNGDCTIFHYNTKATGWDWQAFYRGLMCACKVLGKKRPGIPEWETLVRTQVRREVKALQDEIGGAPTVV
jgi:hypothetical protein